MVDTTHARELQVQLKREKKKNYLSSPILMQENWNIAEKQQLKLP